VVRVNRLGRVHGAWSLSPRLVTALGSFSVEVDDTSARFSITLTNDTDSSVNERIQSIGFDVTPDATDLTDPVAGQVFTNFALYQNFPSFQTVDICAWASNNCSGGSQGGNLAGGGTSDTFGFTLHGDFGSGLTITNLAVKFQGNLGSYELTGTPTSVPEYEGSASFLLLGIGFVAAYGRRRRLG
jgi:hypothetical protein